MACQPKAEPILRRGVRRGLYAMSRKRRVVGKGNGLDESEVGAPAWKGMVKMWVAIVYTMRSSNVTGLMAVKTRKGVLVTSWQYRKRYIYTPGIAPTIMATPGLRSVAFCPRCFSTSSTLVR